MNEFVSITKTEATAYLSGLVNRPLRYALKSEGCLFYDFGFGDYDELPHPCGKGTFLRCEYILHCQCCFNLIYKNGIQWVDKFHEATPCDLFNAKVERLIGLPVKRVALNDLNDLWIDFGDYWFHFLTFEDASESWRFFCDDATLPHLIASRSSLVI